MPAARAASRDTRTVGAPIGEAGCAPPARGTCAGTVLEMPKHTPWTGYRWPVAILSSYFHHIRLYLNAPYGQTPQVCAVLSDRVIRSDTHYLSPPCPSARNTSCMALRSDPERPTDTIRLAVRACSGQDPLLRLGLSGAPTPHDNKHPLPWVQKVQVVSWGCRHSDFEHPCAQHSPGGT